MIVDLRRPMPAVFADALRPKQIPIDLLPKAGKFTDEGGRIAVSAARRGA